MAKSLYALDRELDDEKACREFLNDERLKTEEVKSIIDSLPYDSSNYWYRLETIRELNLPPRIHNLVRKYVLADYFLTPLGPSDYFCVSNWRKFLIENCHL